LAGTLRIARLPFSGVNKPIRDLYLVPENSPVSCSAFPKLQLVQVEIDIALLSQPYPRFDVGGWVFGVQVPRPSTYRLNTQDAAAISIVSWIALRLRGRRVVVVECGAGTAIPTVRNTCEDLSEPLDGTLIRINPREFESPSGHVGLPLRALDG
jgi:hypothetical protein